MLSILIPVYNYNITTLVETLHRQCLKADIIFEILCFDDASMESYKAQNKTVSALHNVIYKELPQNLGRSKIRNALGKAARFEYLLFMDCDSKVTAEDYIKNYIENLESGSLIYGGTLYQTDPPEKDFYFHWYYGTHREIIPLEKRKSSPYHSFKTNNFLIPKSIFLKILFDENLKQYGHEDTIFGLQLRQAQIPIIHIENPLLHEGLETTNTFLDKTHQSIENLLYLSRKNDLINTRLLQTFKKVKSWRLSSLVLFVYRFLKNNFIKNFHSSNIKLRYFDFYKLGFLIEIDSRRKS